MKPGINSRRKEFVIITLLATCTVFVLSLIGRQEDIRQHAQTISQQYYVDSSVGSDNNSGISETSPWKSISKINNTTFSPGSTIYFKRGSTWDQTLTVKNNGVQKSPITYQAYGTGSAPVIDNTSGNGITVTGDWNIIKNFLLKNMSNYGISINNADHNIISDNEITNAGSGVWIAGQYNTITRNNAHDLKMIHNTPGGDDDYGATGFILSNANDNEISYNICTNCKATSYDYGTDGGFVETWENANRNIIHHNFSDNTNGFFEVGGSSASQQVADNKIYYNIVYNAGDILCLHLDGNFAVTVSNMNVENNTFYGGSSIGGCGGSIIQNTVILRNNIIQGGSVSDSGYFIHTDNLYVSQPGFTLGQGEKVADPLFVNAGAKNFHLRLGSPAIDAAAKLGFTKDFENNYVPMGNAPDIGALEYASQSRYPTPTSPYVTPIWVCAGSSTCAGTPAPTNRPDANISPILTTQNPSSPSENPIYSTPQPTIPQKDIYDPNDQRTSTKPEKILPGQTKKTLNNQLIQQFLQIIRQMINLLLSLLGIKK